MRTNKEAKMNSQKQLVIYQAKSGKIEFRGDFDRDTIWGNLKQISELFGRDKSVISRHIKNIFKSEELEQNSVVAKIATTATDGKVYRVDYYNLDMILSIGYRVDSKQATQFRIWATKTLKQHLVQGYTFNKKQIARNYEQFIQAVTDIKALLPENSEVSQQDVLELVNMFASTWFSLDAYDSQNFHTKNVTQQEFVIEAEELQEVLSTFKMELVKKKQATAIFGQEKNRGSVKGIVGNVLQSFGGKDLYPSIEEKAAHLLYFMVKNHPFVDGNKRNGAFAFIWFLQKGRLLRSSFTPKALTALTLLIAEGNRKDKDKMVGLVILLLQK
ncbi:MAG: virulence protein RhuM/Fic/DOC family protein [bacterium]|nr:virulence protein RhuM/Fic/DOC family protein [bacterium]